MKLISIDKNDSIHFCTEMKSYLSPEVVCLPILDKMDKKKNIKKAEKAFGSFASVSGTLTGVLKCQLSSGKKIPCVVLKNDFQEKTIGNAIRKKIVGLSKQEIIGSLFTASLKEKMNVPSFKTLVVSGIDLEPLMANELFIQKEYLQCLLEAIDMLLKAYSGERAIIAISNRSSDIISVYHNFLGTYKNISLKMVPDLYLIGEEIFLTKYLHVRESYLYLKTSELYTLYYQVKKRRMPSEKLITISGDFNSEIQVFLVKIGTRVTELFQSFYPMPLDSYDIYVNGVMRGKTLPIDALIVTDDFSGLVIMKKKKQKVYECIKCGKCNAVCPIHSKPILAYKQGKEIPCIQCGLCSYVCPAFIPLRAYLGGKKHE